MKRIDPNMIPAMFRRIKMKPMRGLHIVEDACCLMSALVIDAGLIPFTTPGDDGLELCYAIDPRKPGVIECDEVLFRLGNPYKTTGFSRTYMEGLNDGWEGVDLKPTKNAARLAGYEDGKAALAAVKKARMKVLKAEDFA